MVELLHPAGPTRGARSAQEPSVEPTSQPATQPQTATAVAPASKSALGPVSSFLPAAAAAARQAPAPAAENQVALALLAVSAGLDPQLLAEPVRAQVLALTQGASGKTTDPARFEQLYGRAGKAIGKESVARALYDLAEAVHAGSMAQAGPQGTRRESTAYSTGGDLRDWHRDWGFTLLSLDNPKMRDGKYLVGWNQEAGQKLSHMRGLTPSGAKGRFETLLREFVPNLRVLGYTASGSDAVNLCFEIARRCGLMRMPEGVIHKYGVDGKMTKVVSEKRPAMLFFSGVYGAGRGEGVAMNGQGWAERHDHDQKRFEVPSPTTYELAPTDPAEIARLEKLEAEALQRIRSLASDADRPVGAIFIEPIQAAQGGYCYRAEFMRQLRALADELKLPIVADEVLTGGGRTGKFFAYQHYEGFEPDFVTFGKGLQASGLASIERTQRVETPDGFYTRALQAPSQVLPMLGVTTADGSAADLHQGAQVLSIIKEDKLVERAAAIGGRLQKLFRELGEKVGAERSSARVFGCLATHRFDFGFNAPVTHAEGHGCARLMPPLDIGDETLDRIEAQMRESIRRPP